jgi:hypothetical protein
MKPSQQYEPVVNPTPTTTGCIFINLRQFENQFLQMNSTLCSKTCSFQGSCERTRAKVKLMPAADVHKLGSTALPSIKTEKTCIMPPRTPVPAIAQGNTQAEIRMSKLILYVGPTGQLAA